MQAARCHAMPKTVPKKARHVPQSYATGKCAGREVEGDVWCCSERAGGRGEGEGRVGWRWRRFQEAEVPRLAAAAAELPAHGTERSLSHATHATTTIHPDPVLVKLSCLVGEEGRACASILRTGKKVWT